MTAVPFTAYAGDCLLHASLDLPDGVRLTDYLNDRLSLTLTDAVMQAHVDGRIVELNELELELSEVFAVEARGARGTPGRRIRTRTARMEVELGPYRVLGHVHSATSADPAAAIIRRKPMVPITNATIAYTLAGETRLRDVETMIINRRLAHSIRATMHHATPLDSLVFSHVNSGAKDLTELSYAS
ncbi:hypothetical protein BH24CHL6_BH24CHL6_10050 [soil metagenome]